jgi:hypothetical protein
LEYNDATIDRVDNGAANNLYRQVGDNAPAFRESCGWSVKVDDGNHGVRNTAENCDPLPGRTVIKLLRATSSASIRRSGRRRDTSATLMYGAGKRPGNGDPS